MPRWRLCEVSCSLLRGSPDSWRRAAEARNVMHRATLDSVATSGWSYGGGAWRIDAS